MRDEELRRRIGQVVEHGERAVSPPDPTLVYRRARRRVARLTTLSVLLACALVAGGLAVRGGLAGDDRFPAVTVPPAPGTTVVPPTTGPPATTDPPATTNPPATASARYPAAPPMVGDAEGTVLAAQLVTPASGWALTRTRLAWTGDGARSWRTITPAAVPAGRVRGAYFLDPRTGWMVASAKERETGSRVRLAVYRTHDAGGSWGWSSLGVLDLGGDDAAGGYEGGFGLLAMPSFVDQRHGWVSVQTVSKQYKAHQFLFRTSDGGRTWTRLPPPPGVVELGFSSRTSGWTVVPGAGSASPGGRGPGLYRTTDAGRGWRRVGLGPPPSLRGTTVHLRESPTFRSPLEGFLPVEFLRNEQGRPRVLAAGFFVTSDGGATWAPRYVPLAEEDEGHGLLPQAVADPRTLVALVGHEARKVLTSRDGGRRWSVAVTGLEGRYPAVRGLAFADPRTGWAVTGRGTSLENGCMPPTPGCDDAGVLLRSTSGGTAWSEVTPAG